jgi:glycosyltransferase involved in cell wall biosynthesis
MIDASVVICSHNPRSQYLRRVLEALRNQTLPKERWELLLVDNASQEPLVTAWDLTWHPSAKHIREHELGIAVARQRGMKEASTDLIVFVDDDNVLAPDYLSQAIKIGKEWPQLGVWGGSIVPEFELQPPSHLRDFLGVLAIRDVTAPLWTNIYACSGAEPWGAGLCIRRIVASAYCEQYEKSTIRLGRQTGVSVIPGEDTEMCYSACKIGLGMGVFPALKLTHLIPKVRIEEDNLLRTTVGIQTAAHLVAFKWDGVIPDSPFSPIACLRHFGRLLLEKGIRRRMYFGSIWAKVKARKIIALDQTRTKSGPVR